MFFNLSTILFGISNFSNKAAVLNGFTDTGDSWQSNYEDPEFRKNLDIAWNGDSSGRRGVREIYEKLHGYMRWIFNKRYGDEYVSKGKDPVPEHLFGNMWAQSWESLYDLAVPSSFEIFLKIFHVNYSYSVLSLI